MPIYDPSLPVGLLNTTKKGPNSRAQQGSVALQGSILQGKKRNRGEHVHAQALPWGSCS
jgi:hypothetical protein